MATADAHFFLQEELRALLLSALGSPYLHLQL